MFEALDLSLDPTNLSLEQLYLDPNNPRFARDDSIREPDDNIDNEALQEELLIRIRRELGLGPLMDSIEQNGYLPIDRIVVREFRNNKYVVLEGNRRIAAAKLLLRRHNEESFLEEPVLDTLKRIPVVLYTGQDLDAAWIFQGIRHISGPKDWPAYTKARLVVERMEKHNLNFTNAGLAFGISAQAAGQYVRGYYTYQQALNHPDYDDAVDPAAFPYFQELFGRSNIPLKEWLDWEERERQLKDDDRFEEFLAWLYPKRDDDPEQLGDWNTRRIPRAIDLRTLSDLITEHPDEFTAFRKGSPLSAAAGRAAAKESVRETGAEYFVKAVTAFADQMEGLPLMKIIKSDRQTAFVQQVERLIGVLQDILNFVER